MVVVVLVSTRTSANDSTTHDSTLHDGFFVGDFWCAKEDTIMSFVARAKASRCVPFDTPKESSIPCSLRNNNSSRRDRKNGHVMIRFSIFLGKLVGVCVQKKKKGRSLCTPNMYKRAVVPRQLYGFWREHSDLVFIGSMILMNLLCFFAR